MSKNELQLTPQQTAAAVTSLNQNAALLAGAGCGKTFVLTRRLTNLLLQNKDVENILSHFIALTFTEKAAMEMSQRLGEVIRQLAKETHSDADRKIFINWLIQLPEAKISTIHGFCASLLRRWAIEANLDPQFNICADEFVINTLLENSIIKAITATADDQCPSLVALLGKHNLTLTRLQNSLRDIINLRDRVTFEEYLSPEKTLDKWKAVQKQLIAELPEKICGDKKLLAAIEELRDMRNSCGDTTDKLYAALEPVAQLAADPGNVECVTHIINNSLGRGGKKDAWSAVGGTTLVREKYKTLQALLKPVGCVAEPIGEIDQSAAELLSDLCSLAIRANEIFHAEKRRQGIIDFNDLIIFSREILATRPDLRQQMAESISQMLIDEAQDTDGQQIDMLLSMLKNSDSRIDDGKLFLVGDAKQSIYRFRGAQLEVFSELCDSLGKENQLPLDISFRTIRPVIDFVNFVFAELMENYQPIDTTRQLAENADTPPAVEILLAEQDGPVYNSADSTNAQALLTAQRIKEMVAGGEKLIYDDKAGEYRSVKYGDIALLFSRMTDSLEYERQLQNAGVPYYVLGGTGFYRRQEIFDLLNALRVIDNPDDDIAFVGLLKSALVGLDDNAVMHIAQNCDKPMLCSIDTSKLTGVLSAGDIETLSYTLDWLKKFSACKDALGTEKLLRETIAATSFLATLQSQFQGSRMVGNVEMLLQRATGLADELTLSEFIEQTNELTVQEFRAEQASVADEADDVVRILTIHKSKGLEYPVVILPDLNHAPRSNSASLLYRRDWGLTTTLTSDDDKPASAGIARNMENHDQDQEFIRKYYVALTRSRDHLILIGANYLAEKSGDLKNKGSLLQRLDELLGVTSKLEQADSAAVKFAGVDVQLKKITPKLPEQKSANTPTGKAMLNSAAGLDEYERSIASTAGKTSALELLGKIPLAAAKVELATTALAEFEKCPALYHWRYELKAPTYLPADNVGSEKSAPTLDPLTLGTLLHRCMELYDFTSPQTPASLTCKAMCELEISADARDEVTALLDDIMRKFQADEISSRIAQADEIHRELDFVNDYGPIKLRGQIDLLYRVGNKWFILDYKSDRAFDDAAIDKKLKQYELQLLAYAEAVTRYTGQAPASVCLYFLRNGMTGGLTIDSEKLSAARDRIIAAGEALINARRNDNFRRCDQDGCDFCRQPHLKHFNNHK